MKTESDFSPGFLSLMLNPMSLYNTRRTFILLMSCLFFPLHQAHPAPNDPVSIPDTELRTAIEAALSKTAGATITESEMATLTALTKTSSTVSDLTGLEYATALTELYLNGNAITDISDLAGLTALETLHLHGNEITDISSLATLTNLTDLRLDSNSDLSDISTLAHLTELIKVALDSTAITFEGLSGVLPSLEDLKSLAFKNTDITDLSVLNRLPSGAKLAVLDVRQMGVGRFAYWSLKDLTPLATFVAAGRMEADSSVSAISPHIQLFWNFLLDYDSIYTDLPRIIAVIGIGGLNSSGVRYDTYQPGLVRHRPATENYAGYPRTRHTFIVRAENEITYVGSTGGDTRTNPIFEGVPVTFTVTAPNGSVTTKDVKTGSNGRASITVTLGNDGETHTIEAVVPANIPASGPQHDELRIGFTATADSSLPPPAALTVTFADYPEERPIDEFTLTIRFSEPVIDFEKEDITVETELTSGEGTATLVDLTPETSVHPARPEPAPVQTYSATVELPALARGSVKLIVRSEAATGISSGGIGPLTDTPSDPIEFGRRRVLIYPSHVAMDTIIFNEFRNAEDDTNDWIELKNISQEAVSLRDWEVSLVTPHPVNPIASYAEILAMDREVVAFPDYTLPPGGVLLILNTDPSENDLIRGQNIGHPQHNPDALPRQLLAPDMKLPSTPYLLILRSQTDKNGTPEAFEDLLGNYYRGDVGYRTQIWPLRDTWVYTGTEAQFTDGEVWERVLAPRVTNFGLSVLQPKERGYLRGAWVLSEIQSGLGYRPGAPIETSLGTPGYVPGGSETEPGSGDLSISEVMFATQGNDERSPAQWIELYNSSEAEVVDLKGWQLVMKTWDAPIPSRSITLTLNGFKVLPNQTMLLVTRAGRHSENISSRRIYDLSAQHAGIRHLGVRVSRLLSSAEFVLYLFSPDGTLVDSAGNLTGRQGQEKPRWELPRGWTEVGARSSMIRRYENRVPVPGTSASSWVSAADTALLMGYSYCGIPTDNGTPGYRQGSPLPVTLSGFRADRTDGAVVVKWTTASEMENAGFYVLRSRHSASDFVQVSPTLILGAGTTAERQTYSYQDTTAAGNTPYYYRLEEVSLSGERRAVGTVRLRGHVSAANKRFYKWADVKSED